MHLHLQNQKGIIGHLTKDVFLCTTFQINSALAPLVIAVIKKKVNGKFSETQSDLHANIWKWFLS